MDSKILNFMLLICATLLFDYSWAYYQKSVQSWVFEALRPKEPPKRISAECGSVITEAYGRLEKSYVRGEVEDGSKCAWILRAPANHVVNIILVGFNLENRTLEQPPPLTDIPATTAYLYSGSNIFIRDNKTPNELLQLTVNDYQQSHGNAFQVSTSSKDELGVEIIYHDNVANAIQKIYVEYEFLNINDMNRLLREHKF